MKNLELKMDNVRETPSLEREIYYIIQVDTLPSEASKISDVMALNPASLYEERSEISWIILSFSFLLSLHARKSLEKLERPYIARFITVSPRMVDFYENDYNLLYKIISFHNGALI